MPPQATSVQTQIISPRTAGWTQTVTFAPFDASLGTLAGVELTSTSSITGAVDLENLEAVATTESVGFAGVDTIAGSGGTSLASYAVSATGTTALHAYDGVTDYAGASGQLLSIDGAGSGDAALPVSFASGTQPITLTVSDELGLTLDGGANLAAQSTASDGAGVQLTYTYIPVTPPVTTVVVTTTLPIIAVPIFVLAPAHTAAQVFTIADATTGWTQALAVNRFDPSLGALSSIDVTITGDIAASAAVENAGAAAADITTTQTATISVVDPSATFSINAAPSVFTSGTLAAFDGVVDDGGASGRTSAGLTDTQTGDGQLFDASDLAAFTGVGTAMLTIGAVGGSVVTGAALLQAALAAKAGATVSVDYGYTPACFVAGTRIATARGEAAVESLVVGDIVRTVSGARPVVWIGHRAIDYARHRDAAAVRPVRVRAGAFGPELPKRDLFLSPDHALHFDGVLIPVRCLVDGDAVATVAVDAVRYFHVELDRHDVLFAEGLPAESFLAAGNRAAFANGGGAVDIHADFAPRAWEAEGYAPLVVAGPAVTAARRAVSVHASRRHASHRLAVVEQQMAVG